MSSPLRFSDHTSFHLQVLRMTIAGACLALGTHLLGLLVPLNGRVSQVIVLAVTATAMGLAALPPRRKAAILACLLGLGVGLLGALGMQALAASTPSYTWFGVVVFGLAVGIVAGRDLRGARRYLLPLATGLTVALATWVDGVFRAELALAHYVPAFLAEPVHGALFGFLVSVAMLARQLTWHRDPVTKAFEEVRPLLSGEMLELSEQALGLYTKTQNVLRDRRQQGNETEPALHQAVEKLVLRIFSMGRQWQEVEQGAGSTSADELAARIEGLERKIEASADEVARKQYRLALEALNTQLKYLRDISRNRERVTARVHNYLATLERLHLALWNHRGADAAKLSDEVQPILDEIEDVGTEMDFASQAIDEVTDVAEDAAPGAAVVASGGSDDAEAAAAAAADDDAEPRPATSGGSDDAEAVAAAADDDAAPGPASSEDPDDAEGGPEQDPESRLAARAFE